MGGGPAQGCADGNRRKGSIYSSVVRQAFFGQGVDGEFFEYSRVETSKRFEARDDKAGGALWKTAQQAQGPTLPGGEGIGIAEFTTQAGGNGAGVTMGEELSGLSSGFLEVGKGTLMLRQAPFVISVFDLQITAQGAGSENTQRLGRPGDNFGIEEGAIRQVALAFQQQVAQHMRVEVAHGNAVADATQGVDGALVAQVTKGRGEVEGHTEWSAPAVGDLDAFEVREEEVDVLFEVLPCRLVAIAVQVVGISKANRTAAHHDAVIGRQAVIMDQVACIFQALVTLPAYRGELFRSERLGSDHIGKGRHLLALQLREEVRVGIGGKDQLFRSYRAGGGLEDEFWLGGNFDDRSVFKYLDAQLAGQSFFFPHQFGRVDQQQARLP